MLKIKFNDGRQESIWVVEKNFTIGSADDNSLVIDDGSVSPQHAKITCTHNTYTLKDLNSASGSKVNGKNVSQSILACHDRITLGDVDITLIDPSAEAREFEWSLIGNSGFLAGQEFPLLIHTDHSIIIGRGKRCDIAFPGTQLSKEHAKLTVTAEGLKIEDLQSSNGVFVNDERVTSALVYSGDKVRFDVYKFCVFGPGLDAPCSAAGQLNPPTQTPAAQAPSAKTHKQWITRPTSPGNRLEKPEKGGKPPFSLLLFSFIMIMLLLGFSGYLFL